MEIMFKIYRIDTHKFFICACSKDITQTKHHYIVLDMHEPNYKRILNFVSEISKQYNKIKDANYIFDKITLDYQTKDYKEIKNGEFIVKDLYMFSDWNFDHWFSASQKYDFINDILPVLEEHRPVRLYMDGFVEGSKNNYCIDLIDISDAPFSVDEFIKLWSKYGYPNQPPDFY